MMFEKMHMSVVPTVNAVAGTVFGVYLIHDNPLVRAWLWPHFSFAAGLPVPLLVVSAVAAALTVFAICSVVDMVRLRLLEPPVMRAVDRLCGGLFERADRAVAQVQGGGSLPGATPR